ncbi:MAG: type II secretion system protein GspC [Deltaproteobacteria bacterium]|nr:type II secretion system protein GspC [Deltaproteobacteria bacterium]
MLALLKQYLWVLNLLTVLLSSYFGAKLINLYIESRFAVESGTKEAKVIIPTTATTVTRAIKAFSDYQVILDRNIFDSTDVPIEAVAVTEDEVPTGQAVQTSLAIKVLGVLVVGLGEDGRSSATIASGGGGSDTYFVGDTGHTFAPNTKLLRVAPDRIEFLHNNRLEFALIEDLFGSIFGPPDAGTTTTTAAVPTMPTPSAEPGAGVKKEGERFVIDQAEVSSALNNIEQLYTEIRAVPNFAGGKVSGMKILSVKQGSIFDKLGLQRGDILQRINGLELDVKRGFELFEQLKTEKNLTLDLVRKGSNQTLEYEIR